jgi:hypothetical protein
MHKNRRLIQNWVKPSYHMVRAFQSFEETILQDGCVCVCVMYETLFNV